jgi:hypothetical protein
MLQFKNNLLSSEPFSIDSPDYIFQLLTDTPECNYFGAITLTNKVVKTLQFIKFNNIFKARLSLTLEDLNYLQGATFKLISVSSSFTKESNLLTLSFDINKIKLTIKQESSKEMLELKKQISALTTKLEALSLGKLVPNVNIINKDYIQPGMILVAIDNGNFMAAYPFADIVTNVNGQQAVDGVVEINASMIKYNTERTIEEQLKVIAKAIQTQNSTIKTIAGELGALSERVATLSMQLATHLDSGVV